MCTYNLYTHNKKRYAKPVSHWINIRSAERGTRLWNNYQYIYCLLLCVFFMLQIWKSSRHRSNGSGSQVKLPLDASLNHRWIIAIFYHHHYRQHRSVWGSQKWCKVRDHAMLMLSPFYILRFLATMRIRLHRRPAALLSMRWLWWIYGFLACFQWKTDLQSFILISQILCVRTWADNPLCFRIFLNIFFSHFREQSIQQITCEFNVTWADFWVECIFFCVVEVFHIALSLLNFNLKLWELRFF